MTTTAAQAGTARTGVRTGVTMPLDTGDPQAARTGVTGATGTTPRDVTGTASGRAPRATTARVGAGVRMSAQTAPRTAGRDEIAASSLSTGGRTAAGVVARPREVFAVGRTDSGRTATLKVGAAAMTGASQAAMAAVAPSATPTEGASETDLTAKTESSADADIAAAVTTSAGPTTTARLGPAATTDAGPRVTGTTGMVAVTARIATTRAEVGSVATATGAEGAASGATVDGAGPAPSAPTAIVNPVRRSTRACRSLRFRTT